MKRVLSLLLIAMMLGSLGSVALASEAKGDSSLKTLAEKYGFKMGAAFSYNQLSDNAYLELIKAQFNSVTPTNELKAYSLLDQQLCKQSPDGMPAMRYHMAEKMLDFAQANGIKVRGHVLVWDAYMKDWFFREGYDQSKPYADKETMRLRLQSYITQVTTHFETKYPGLIYCWDVVNEAVGDNATEYVPSDPRHVRTMRNGQVNPFYEYVGEDYVELSFLYARDAFEAMNADVKLFYNDYNAFMTGKREAMIALVSSINNYAKDENGNPRKLIDGVGMQGYIGGYGTQQGCMSSGDLSNIKTAIENYAKRDVEVQLTEMAVRNYQNDEASIQKHAEYYGNLFKLLKSINLNNESKPLTAVTIWGLFDLPTLPKNDYSYLLNSPYGGLYTETYAEKDAYKNVVAVLSEE